MIIYEINDVANFLAEEYHFSLQWEECLFQDNLVFKTVQRFVGYLNRVD